MLTNQNLLPLLEIIFSLALFFPASVLLGMSIFRVVESFENSLMLIYGIRETRQETFF
jgi:hypothetical protein